jgi:hypothetical protein
MQCAQGEQSRGRCGGGKQPATSRIRAGGGTEAAAVEEDEETKREDERGMAKRPDLNELDVPEWAELALHTSYGGSYCSASPRSMD